MKKILIVEDDNNINGMLRTALGKAGYECGSAFSGTEALLLAGGWAFDLVILDLMLPGMAGEEVLKAFREKSEAPILVLSARDELDTKVDLLNLGANDYMTKPFELKELLARVQVQLRSSRGLSADKMVLKHRELMFDSEKKTLFLKGEPLALTVQELKIMELFLKHPGRVFSKNELYEYAWNDFYIGEDNTINVHISNIRQKMKKVTEEEYIETVWGLGFKLS